MRQWLIAITVSVIATVIAVVCMVILSRVFPNPELPWVFLTLCSIGAFNLLAVFLVSRRYIPLD